MTEQIAPKKLLNDLRHMIAETRQNVAQTINSGLVALYWNIGARIRTELLKEARAEYGRKIVHAVSAQLSAEYGVGFSEKSLRHMVRFAEAFPEEQIVSATRRQLSWTHFKQIIYLDDPLRREFYAEMCRIERNYASQVSRHLPINKEYRSHKLEH